jgi:indolepyruvate ferredoxin oxidoreductase alpha subunit
MGSSISTAQGISRTTGQNTIAIVGDSTFFHATLPGLVNAVYNNAKVVLAVLDNQTTAMTGNQPHPGTGTTGMHNPSERVSIEKTAEGLGVKYVRVVDPFKTKEAEATLKEALQQQTPAVVVFRSPCTLVLNREKRRKGITTQPVRINSRKCQDCMVCIKTVGCPAIILGKERTRINETLCTACGLCVAACPYKAIEGGT